MKLAPSKPRMGSRGRPEESRAAILDAAVREFSREGAAGARTDAIARAARVNKALLYPMRAPISITSPITLFTLGSCKPK